MALRIGCVVEGQGEIKALPILLRRLAANHQGLIVSPLLWRVAKSQLVRTNELQRTLEAISRQIGRDSPILILLDADRDCPVVLADRLLSQSRQFHSDLRVSIVIAKCEYEAWFLAAAESLNGHGGLRHNLIPPADPESILGAKEWLTQHMNPGNVYSETKHQAAFTAQLDFDKARRSPSFRKCEREIRKLFSVTN